jgi:hypothetical protein
MGDVPIFAAHDSADVWAHRELFFLGEDGRPTHVAGVPPDYFSATGQRWGNPLYRWREMKRAGYRWWIDRFRATLALFDRALVRAGGVEGPPGEHDRRERHVGPAVHHDLDVLGEELARAGHAGAVPDPGRVALGGGGHVLRPVVDHLD